MADPETQGSSSFKERFRKDPVQNTIIFCVIAIHFIFILFILVSPAFVLRKKEHKPLIVKTIVPKPISKTAAVEKKTQASRPSSPAAPAAKKQESVKTEVAKSGIQPKKEPPPTPVATKKPPVKQPPAPKKEPAIADKTINKNKKPPAKKTPPPADRAKISDSLLQELEQSIAKIEKNDKPQSVKKSPAGVKPLAPIALQIDSAATDESSADDSANDYTDILVGHLHSLLSLPDYGEVKIQLSLRQDGTVVKLIVLKTQSEKNKQYLESNLPLLKFPRFEGAYANKKEYTFILTFCNE